MGALCGRPATANAQLLKLQALRSDDHVTLDAERAEGRRGSADSMERRQRRVVEQLHNDDSIGRDGIDQLDTGIDSSTLPYRIFLRGAMIGCALVAAPMIALIWIVVSNGFLYRFYPLLESERR